MAGTPPPSDKDKIVEALTLLAGKSDDQNAALIELANQTRETKKLLSDIIAQRTQYAADIKDLDASIAATRRALDPEQLGAHVANNNTAFMGDITQKFAKAIQISLNAAEQNTKAAQQSISANADMADKITKLERESRTLANIAERLEERDAKSKWDWVTLGCAMAVAAALAGGGAYYYAKAQIEADSFTQAVNRIAQDTDAGWCDIARGQIVSANDGSKHCAIAMMNYVEPEPAAE